MTYTNNRMISKTGINKKHFTYSELKSTYNLYVAGIYKIENLINHKAYIGQSINIIKRLKEHCSNEHNVYLNREFKKYGFENFSFEILKETYDLNYWEKFLIQIYHSTDNQYGYNMTYGGEGGIPTDDVKHIISKMKRGKTPKLTSEQRERQKRITSERTSRAVYCYNNKHTYKSIRECAYNLQLPESSVGRCCRNEIQRVRGFNFCFKENYNPEYKLNLSSKSRPVICLSTKKIYMSISSTPNPEAINNCLLRKSYKSINLQWYYLDEFFKLNLSTDSLILNICEQQGKTSFKKKL